MEDSRSARKGSSESQVHAVECHHKDGPRRSRNYEVEGVNNMKLTSTKIDAGSREEVYPCLKTNDKHKHVVLFTRAYQGTVVHAGDGFHPLGKYSTCWIMANYVDYHAGVLLQNESG